MFGEPGQAFRSGDFPEDPMVGLGRHGDSRNLRCSGNQFREDGSAQYPEEIYVGRKIFRPTFMQMLFFRKPFGDGLRSQLRSPVAIVYSAS